MSEQILTVGIVAGEASGDILAAPMMAAIRNAAPSVRFIGVGGPQMLNEGLESLFDIESLSVNGFVEPLRRLPSLIHILVSLIRAFKEADVVVGVDFNVFNLILERQMKKRGIPTAHYVSPSVYAWRRGRLRKIARSTDVMMTLFPFEPQLYRDAGIQAEFVGHPTADQHNPGLTKVEARRGSRHLLGLSLESTVVTLMPGSRRSEIQFHLTTFLKAAQLFCSLIEKEQITFLIPYPKKGAKADIEECVSDFPDLDVRLLENGSCDALAASDVALIKSGTGTLEALFAKTPMVVAYVIGSLTFRIVRRMMYTDLVALPNILNGSQLVPEYLQQDATPENLAGALVEVYRASSRSGEIVERFTEIHTELKRDASTNAARVVLATIA